MKFVRLLALAGWLSLQAPLPWVAGATPLLTLPGRTAAGGAGGPVIQRSLVIPGRIDSLLALPSGQVAVLVGRVSSPIRFLPHDDLLRVTLSSGAVLRVPLPPYIVPPGLAASGGGVAVVVDDMLLWVAGTGRLAARWPLDMAAVGWPAAVTADRAGRLYLAGQEADAWSAQVEALSPLGRVLWRVPLGLTHAGIWLGMAGPRELAAYLPDAHDAQGALALFDTHSSRLRASYALPAAPLAIDAARGLLYLGTGAGTIQTRALSSGRLLFTVPGAVPLALCASTGWVAFTRGNEVVVTVPQTLQVKTSLRLPGVTALTFTADGTLLAGVGARLDEIMARL
ncbi:MAG TPA: hypothetical protein VNL71_14035 [Chloroflexota bacterium]|nr:hypothetical protein [Chloroflexota bacterium]